MDDFVANSRCQHASDMRFTGCMMLKRSQRRVLQHANDSLKLTANSHKMFYDTRVSFVQLVLKSLRRPKHTRSMSCRSLKYSSLIVHSFIISLILVSELSNDDLSLFRYRKIKLMLYDGDF